MPTLEQLGIDRLTTAERLALVQEILDSVAADQPRPPLSDAKRQELDRRSARLVAQRRMAVGPSHPQTRPHTAITTMSMNRCLRFWVCRGSGRDSK